MSIWLTITLALLPLLIRLLGLLNKTKSEGGEIPARVKKRLERVQNLMREIDNTAVGMGCDPAGR